MNFINHIKEYCGFTRPIEAKPTYCFVTKFPIEIITRIFYLSFSEHSSLLCVSKTWASLKTNPALYNQLYSRIHPHIFNKKSIEECWGELDSEPKLPLFWLCDFDPQNDTLTLVPEKIKRQGTGNFEYLRLGTFLKLAQHPSKGNPIQFSQNLNFDSFRLVEASHWVWIRRSENHVESHHQDFPYKEMLEESHFIVDLTVSVIAKYLLTGKTFSFCQPDEDTSVLFLNPGKKFRIGIIFKDSEITFVNTHTINPIFLFARRSFGTDLDGNPIAPTGSPHPELDELTIPELKARLKKAKIKRDLLQFPTQSITSNKFEDELAL